MCLLSEAMEEGDYESRTPQKAIMVGDALCDAIEAKRGVGAIGMLSGGFLRHDLEVSGCVAVYRGPADLLAHYDETVRLRA